MKATIIGAGQVGSTTCFYLLAGKTVDELALIDIAEDRARGEAFDLMHASSHFGKSVVVSGSSDFADAQGSDIVVITAGIPRRPGDNRLDLLKKNTAIMGKIIDDLMEHVDDSILLVVSNPVDVMTYVAQKKSGFDYQKVFGLGTVLDSLRLRSTIANKLSVNPSEVSALMAGEHGDSMFAAYSQSKISGESVEESGKMTKEEFIEIAVQVRKTAAEVIQLKGATYYAPAVAVGSVVEAISGDKGEIMPVSTYNSEHGIYVSTLAKVGRRGANPIQIQFDEKEQFLFEESVKILKDACEMTGL
ncbi:MAG: malate dehydrogenase [Methanobacteriota archaeon]